MKSRRLRAAFVPGVARRTVGSRRHARGMRGDVEFLVALSLTLGLILGASSARANHIPGALYTGTHSGSGTVEFHVSADCASISGFTVLTPAEACKVNRFFAPPGIPIRDHTFSWSNGDFSLSGSFPGIQTASGSFTFASGYSAGCGDTVTWT